MHLKIFIHNYDAMNSKSSLLSCTFLVKITFTRKSKLQKKISKTMGRGLSIQLIRHLRQWSKQKIIQTFSTDYVHYPNWMNNKTYQGLSRFQDE